MYIEPRPAHADAETVVAGKPGPPNGTPARSRVARLSNLLPPIFSVCYVEFAALNDAATAPFRSHLKNTRPLISNSRRFFHMHLKQTLAAILLCATTFALAPAANAAATSQKARASKAQAPAPQTEITKEKVEAIISAIEQSVKKKDTAVIISYLAPDMKYTLDAGGRPTRQANRAEYIQILKLGIELTLDYTYLRKSLTINIAPDGQSATAQAEAFEMLTTAQGTLAGHSASLTTFKIYKGKILISAMEGSIEYV